MCQALLLHIILTPEKYIVLLASVYKREQSDNLLCVNCWSGSTIYTERSSNLLKVAQLTSGRPGVVHQENLALEITFPGTTPSTVKRSYVEFGNRSRVSIMVS